MGANPSDSLSHQTRESRRILKILESNWQAEMQGYYTHEILAERDRDPLRRGAFRNLADAEQHHVDLWADRIRALGGSEPIYGGSKTGEANRVANRVGGASMALRRLELDGGRDIAKYAKQLKDLGAEPSINILKQVLEDERDHYRILGSLIRNRRPIPQSSPEQAKQALNELLVASQQGHPSVTQSMESTTASERSWDCFRCFWSDTGQQQIRNHRRNGGYGCERALHEFWRLPRGQK